MAFADVFRLCVRELIRVAKSSCFGLVFYGWAERNGERVRVDVLPPDHLWRGEIKLKGQKPGDQTVSQGHTATRTSAPTVMMIQRPVVDGTSPFSRLLTRKQWSRWRRRLCEQAFHCIALIMAGQSVKNWAVSFLKLLNISGVELGNALMRANPRGEILLQMDNLSAYADRRVAFFVSCVCRHRVGHAVIVTAVALAVACSVFTQYGIKFLVDTLTQSERTAVGRKNSIRGVMRPLVNVMLVNVMDACNRRP
jgi:hypothetical protein